MFDFKKLASTKPALPEQSGQRAITPSEAEAQDLLDARNFEWEQTRQTLINQTQGNTYSQLRAIQVTLAIGCANGDFSIEFRNDVKRLLLQMAVGVEVQDDPRT